VALVTTSDDRKHVGACLSQLKRGKTWLG